MYHELSWQRPMKTLKDDDSHLHFMLYEDDVYSRDVDRRAWCRSER